MEKKMCVELGEGRREKYRWESMKERRDLTENEMASSQKSWLRENKQLASRHREWQAGSDRECRKVHNSTEGRDGSQAQGQILIFEVQDVWEYSDQGPLFSPTFA